MLVSVIIPTLDRPKLLLRAIGSVLRQTHRELEVIIVVCRPEPETASAVRSVEDARVRLVLNPGPSTPAAARNVGAEYASGEWLAFLDDDDEWLPNKLERQLAFASVRGSALISCLSRVVTPTAIYTRPQVIYDNSSFIDDYLFDRRTLFRGTGLIQSSSFLLPRWLFDKVRFNVESVHDDWEFVLRLSKQAGERIETVPEVLVVLYFEEQRPTYSKSTSWSCSLKWLQGLRPILTRRAFSGICLNVVGSRAAQEGCYSAFPTLLYLAFRYGSPRRWHVLSFLAYWLIPRAFQQQLRRLLRKRRGY